MVIIKRRWRSLLVGFVVVSVTTTGAFWIIPKAKTLDWGWTGFGESTTKEETRQKKDKTGSFTETIKYQSGKTLWDWLELAGTLAVPILLAVLGYQFQQRDKKRAEEQAKEEAIQNYLDRIAELLLPEDRREKLFPNDKSDSSDNDNSVRDVARILTITILRRLEGDKERQERIIHFLRDAELHEFILKNAYFQEADLREANLRKVNLSRASLEKANMPKRSLLLIKENNDKIPVCGGRASFLTAHQILLCQHDNHQCGCDSD